MSVGSVRWEEQWEERRAVRNTRGLTAGDKSRKDSRPMSNSLNFTSTQFFLFFFAKITSHCLCVTNFPDLHLLANHGTFLMQFYILSHDALDPETILYQASLR
ncbi:uncharacterized protein ACO6RY_02480 [Pungitius sinensis]